MELDPHKLVPKINIGGMYLKPLFRPGDLLGLDSDKILRKLKSDLLKRIKLKLTQTSFSLRAKKSLAKALKIEIRASSVKITVKHPAWLPLIEGQKSQQMTWLVKAKAPIPIITETGELIFRSATPKSMADGKWVHPGREPTHFIDKAKKESAAFLRKKIAEELRRQVRAAWATTG